MSENNMSENNDESLHVDECGVESNANVEQDCEPIANQFCEMISEADIEAHIVNRRLSFKAAIDRVNNSPLHKILGYDNAYTEK